MSTTMSSAMSPPFFSNRASATNTLFFTALVYFLSLQLVTRIQKQTKNQKNNNEHTKYTFWVLFTTITKAKEQCTMLTVPLLGTKCLS